MRCRVSFSWVARRGPERTSSAARMVRIMELLSVAARKAHAISSFPTRGWRSGDRRSLTMDLSEMRVK